MQNHFVGLYNFKKIYMENSESVVGYYCKKVKHTNIQLLICKHTSSFIHLLTDSFIHFIHFPRGLRCCSIVVASENEDDEQS